MEEEVRGGVEGTPRVEVFVASWCLLARNVVVNEKCFVETGELISGDMKFDCWREGMQVGVVTRRRSASMKAIMQHLFRHMFCAVLSI